MQEEKKGNNVPNEVRGGEKIEPRLTSGQLESPGCEDLVTMALSFSFSLSFSAGIYYVVREMSEVVTFNGFPHISLCGKPYTDTHVQE